MAAPTTPTKSKDPQEAKFDAHPAPPRWEEPKAAKPAPAWEPEPALDPHAEKPPPGVYADGMDVATEQRARAAWVEEQGLEKYDEATDQRPADEKPKFEKAALAIGGAFIAGAAVQKQVQGVAPPTKRPAP